MKTRSSLVSLSVLATALLASSMVACISEMATPLDGVGERGNPDEEIEADAGPSVDGAPVEEVPSKPDFQYIYAKYIGPSTAGSCGNAGCHQIKTGGFFCGSSAKTCFEGLIKVGLIDTEDPSASTLIDAKESPLVWINPKGKMPSGGHANGAAALAIRKWIAAGAQFENAAQRPADAGGKDAGETPVIPPVDAGAPDSGNIDSGIVDAGQPDTGHGGAQDAGAVDAGSVDSGTKDAGPTAPTWTTIYTTYFGANTPGSCGNSGCHATTRAGFKCGTSKSVCYSGLISAGLIDPANPEGSDLISTSASPLRWISAQGVMPPSSGTPAGAKADLRAWVLAGAKNN